MCDYNKCLGTLKIWREPCDIKNQVVLNIHISFTNVNKSVYDVHGYQSRHDLPAHTWNQGLYPVQLNLPPSSQSRKHTYIILIPLTPTFI